MFIFSKLYKLPENFIKSLQLLNIFCHSVHDFFAKTFLVLSFVPHNCCFHSSSFFLNMNSVPSSSGKSKHKLKSLPGSRVNLNLNAPKWPASLIHPPRSHPRLRLEHVGKISICHLVPPSGVQSLQGLQGTSRVHFIPSTQMNKVDFQPVLE